jgi:hypothetical protein
LQQSICMLHVGTNYETKKTDHFDLQIVGWLGQR